MSMLHESVSILEGICIGIVGGYDVDGSVAEGEEVDPNIPVGRSPSNEWAIFLGAWHNRVKQREWGHVWPRYCSISGREMGRTSVGNVLVNTETTKLWWRPAY